MNWLRRLLLLVGLAAGPAAADEAEIVKAALTEANSAAQELMRAGYQTDFTFQSLKEVERFMAENSENGRATPGGHLTTGLGAKIFAIGSYVGEVLRRELKGKWVGSDEDPEGELNLAIEYGDGAVIWPIQRVMKRFQNGEEDNIWFYANIIARP